MREKGPRNNPEQKVDGPSPLEELKADLLASLGEKMAGSAIREIPSSVREELADGRAKFDIRFDASGSQGVLKEIKITDTQSGKAIFYLDLDSLRESEIGQ